MSAAHSTALLRCAMDNKKKREKQKTKKTKKLQLNPKLPKMLEVQTSNQRKSWSREKKLEIIRYAKQYNNYQAALKYGVDRKSIREWIAKSDAIYNQHSGARSKRGRFVEFPILEEKLYRMFEKRKKEGKKTTEKWLRKMALILHRESGSEARFTASRGWFDRFRERKHISPRAPTKKGNKSVSDKEPLIRDYHQRLRSAITKWGPFPPFRTCNFDQTPMPFAFWSGKTYANKGDRQVWVKTLRSGDDKRFCTVNPTVFGDGRDRVKPLIIFRGKGLRISQKEKEKWHPSVKVEYQPDAWMNEDQVKKYLKSQLRRFKERGTPGKLLLTLDAHKSQRTKEVRDLMQSLDMIDVQVPPGCTGEVQVLDVAFNKEFIRIVQEQFDEYMDKNMDKLEGGISESERRILVTKWVGRAWRQMHPPPERKCEAVINAFRYTGVTLPVDGSADNEIRIPGLNDYKAGKSLSEDLKESQQFRLVTSDESDYEDSLAGLGESDDNEIIISSHDNSPDFDFAADPDSPGHSQALEYESEENDDDAKEKPRTLTVTISDDDEENPISSGRSSKYRRVIVESSDSDSDVPPVRHMVSGFCRTPTAARFVDD